LWSKLLLLLLLLLLGAASELQPQRMSLKYSN
jgi:hypothetical protein